MPPTLWRERVIGWFNDVADHVGEARETVFVASDILDRFVVVNSLHAQSERHYETAALTALFLAVRIAGNATLEVFDVIRMSRSGVRVREIVDCGKRMTSSLSWDRRLFTPTQFLKAAINALPVSLADTKTRNAIIEAASHLAHLSVSDSFFVGMKPSKIALAALSIIVSRHHDSVRSAFDEIVKVGFGASSDDQGLCIVRNRLLHSQSLYSHQSHPITDSTESLALLPNQQQIYMNGMARPSYTQDQEPIPSVLSDVSMPITTTTTTAISCNNVGQTTDAPHLIPDSDENGTSPHKSTPKRRVPTIDTSSTTTTTTTTSTTSTNKRRRLSNHH